MCHTCLLSHFSGNMVASASVVLLTPVLIWFGASCSNYFTFFWVTVDLISNQAIKAWSFAEADRSEDDVEFGLGVTLANPAYDEDIPLLKQIKVPVAEQDDDRDHVDEMGQRNPGTGLQGLAEAPLAGADGVLALGPGTVDSHILRGVGRGQDSLGG